MLPAFAAPLPLITGSCAPACEATNSVAKNAGRILFVMIWTGKMIGLGGGTETKHDKVDCTSRGFVRAQRLSATNPPSTRDEFPAIRGEAINLNGSGFVRVNVDDDLGNSVVRKVD